MYLEVLLSNIQYLATVFNAICSTKSFYVHTSVDSYLAASFHQYHKPLHVGGYPGREGNGELMISHKLVD